MCSTRTHYIFACSRFGVIARTGISCFALRLSLHIQRKKEEESSGVIVGQDIHYSWIKYTEFPLHSYSSTCVDHDIVQCNKANKLLSPAV